jgi:hypothetical protein
MMSLDEFAAGWLAAGPVRPPLLAYEKAGGNAGITLYRDDRFQVQLWALPPASVVTEHSHPEIDTCLVRVAGKIRLKINGNWIPLHAMGRTQWLGMRTWMMRVRPGDLHEVKVGRPGGSFLAISERIDGHAPVSVHLNWQGAALDGAHQAALGGV